MSKKIIYYNASSSGSSPDFISTWDTTQAGSASDTIILPMTAGPTVDWGDGNTDTTNTHTYTTGGIYTVTISGTINTFRFANTGDRRKITDVSNWGGFVLSNNSIFKGCVNLDISATDAPIITPTSFNGLFYQCTSLTTPDFSAWDTSTVTDTRSMFYQATSFNGDVSTWDMSNVIYIGINQNFAGMFESATAFAGDISNWDLSSVLRADKFAFNATNFSSDVSGWVIPASWFSMNKMFQNSGMDSDLSSWDITGITILNNFLTGGQMSTANYDATLIGWAAQLPITYSGIIDMGGSTYDSGDAAVVAARNAIISSVGGITDGGAA